MLYLAALIFPPLGPFLSHKAGQGFVNLILWICAWPLLFAGGVGTVVFVVCMVHALFVVHGYYADQRMARMIAAMRADRLNG